jgi:hypothetical protein
MSKDIQRAKQIDSLLFRTEACYSGEFDPAAIDLWHESLGGYKVSDISAAFSIHIKQCKFLPKISEIIEILNNNLGPVLKIEVRAQAEWRKVMLAVRQRGLNRGSPEFKDPITRHLVQAQFNWEYLCGFQAKDMNWEQKRWCEAYELASEIDLDQLRIESKSRIKKIVGPIGGNDENTV